MTKPILLSSAAALGALALAAQPAAARVTAFEVTARAPAYDGKSFGTIGAYERIDATARFAIDPKSERGRKIVDLDKAPTNAEGDVEFSTEVTILTPADPASQSGTLFYEVPNRGRNLSFQLLNLSAGAGNTFSVDDPGDGLLMSRGYTMAWAGWQTDLGDELIDMTLPVLQGVTGPSREEYVFDKDEAVSTATLTYPAADLDPAKATLTVRQNATDERQTPADLSFRYVDDRTIEITRPAGMDAGAIYEFIYPARDSLPTGLAFIATADVVSFLRGGSGHDVESPVSGIDRTIGMGISQSGRFMRDLVYQGFNVDEAGATVFDGVMPHIAGSRKTFTNYRFGQPGRYSRQHEDHDVQGDQFPFTYAETNDPISGRTESILTACEASESCPKVIQTDTSTEFWQARASLVATTPTGEDLAMPDTVRLFFMAGAPHFNSWGGESKATSTCVFDSNPVSPAPTMRALTVAMDAWLRDGKAPPASIYPSVADGSLVAPAELDLPTIDGAVPAPVINRLQLRDHTTMPPTGGAEYRVLVPAVDADGIPQGGVKQPAVAAPLGTYWGWNLRAERFAPGQLCGLTGSYIPFPKTASNADSRRPLAERYVDAAAFEAAVSAAADELVAGGLMLPDDVGIVLEGSAASAAMIGQ